MRPIKILAAVAFVALVALAGCDHDDGVTDPGQSDLSSTGLVRGEINGAADFEFLSGPAGGPDDPRPGPFLIRGQDLRYDAELGALLVDLTVTNAGERSFPLPASLTFVSLLPDTVEILNADNGETGPGAMFELRFENDDLEWTPGETSIPFTVQFGVAQGVSIGFVARVDVGMIPGGGSIGGVVWHDRNEDGVIGDGEEGLAEVGVALVGPGDLHRLATTGPDGEYRFDGLAAGHYTVTRLPRDDLRATTPPQMQVLLVEDEEGEVSDFMGANFGCLVVDAPPPGDVIQVGDCLHVKGDFGRDPLRLEAHHYCFCDEDDDDDDDGDEDKDPDCWGRLSGPVTRVDLEHHVIAVMGAAIHLTEDTRVDLDLEHLEPGRRVRAEVSVVSGDDGDRLVACRLRPFNGHWDRVRGHVARIGTNDDGRILAAILGVVVDLTDAGECEDDD